MWEHSVDCGGCSSVGRALGCGSKGRGFDPRHSPHRIEPLSLKLIENRMLFCFGNAYNFGSLSGVMSGV